MIKIKRLGKNEKLRKLGKGIAVPMIIWLSFTILAPILRCRENGGELAILAGYCACSPYDGFCQVNYWERMKHPDLAKFRINRMSKHVQGQAEWIAEKVRKLELSDTTSLIKIEKTLLVEVENSTIAKQAYLNPNTYLSYPSVELYLSGYQLDAYLNPYEVAYFPKEKLWRLRSKGFFTFLDIDDLVIEIPHPKL